MSEAKNSGRLPAFQFYPADWRKDPGVQALDYETRGIWWEIICLLHESDERGVLLLNRLPMPEDALCRLLGLDNQKLTTSLSMLLTYGVAKRRDSDGAIYSKRMVADERLRQIRKEAGAKGGNPALLNQKATTEVKQKTTPSSSSSSSSSPSGKQEGAEAPSEQLALESAPKSDTVIRSQPPAKKKKGGAVRERNELLDALAVVGGVELEKVTRALWQETATALRDIREVCAEVTPGMIGAAAARYRAKWPKATLSPSALAKHWGAFGAEKADGAGGDFGGTAAPREAPKGWELAMAACFGADWREFYGAFETLVHADQRQVRQWLSQNAQTEPAHGSPSYRPFSNGSEFMDWTCHNCERCIKGPKPDLQGPNESCDIENAFAMASIGGGKLVDECIGDEVNAAAIATRLGWDGLGSLPARCSEFVDNSGGVNS